MKHPHVICIAKMCNILPQVDSSIILPSKIGLFGGHSKTALHVSFADKTFGDILSEEIDYKYISFKKALSKRIVGLT